MPTLRQSGDGDDAITMLTMMRKRSMMMKMRMMTLKMMRKQTHNRKVCNGKGIGADGKAIQRRQRRNHRWQRQSISVEEKEKPSQLGSLTNPEPLASRHPH